MAVISAFNTAIISCFSSFSELVTLFYSFIPFFLFVLLVSVVIRMCRIFVGVKVDSAGKENKPTVSDTTSTRATDLDPWDRDWLK